jgi:hypothetical protein
MCVAIVVMCVMHYHTLVVTEVCSPRLVLKQLSIVRTPRRAWSNYDVNYVRKKVATRPLRTTLVTNEFYLSQVCTEDPGSNPATLCIWFLGKKT